MEEIKFKAFLEQTSGYGYGDGSGDGYGSGYGDGSGFGGFVYGYGYGYGDGSGSGSGYGSGYGYGDGSGSGSGYGYGYGYGSGDGSGYGDGDGIDLFRGRKLYLIDEVPTILHSVHGNVAKGSILRSDMSLDPCYIVKGSGFFAHGETLRAAMDALADKVFGGMPESERIAAFVAVHPEYRTPYSNEDLFRWHHNLTGSCEMGRKAFVEERGLSLDGETTVEDFVALTINAYGGSTIAKLKTAYS